MDVRITKRMANLDIVVKDFIVSSIPIIPVYEEVEGRNGTVDQGATYGTLVNRSVSSFYFFVNDNNAIDATIRRFD